MLWIASIVLLLVGRALGTLELMLLGVAIATLLSLSILRTATHSLRLTAEREVSPQRIFQGSACRVDLKITNSTRRKTPPIRVSDRMEGSAPITFGIPVVRSRTSLTIPYQLSTHKRGRITIGPLHISALDPFHVTQARRTIEVLNEIIVYPKIERLRSLPNAAARDMEPDLASRSVTGSGGEEFYALRPFEIGDELRRVHWPSTARFDELHIRQTNLPSYARLTVLLDLRPDSQTEESLDYSVGFAASVLAAAQNTGLAVRLVATDGADSGFVTDKLSHDAILDYLATVELGRNTNLINTLNTVSSTGSGGAFIVFSSHLASHDTKRIQVMAHSFASLTYVLAVDSTRPLPLEQDATYHAPTVLVPPEGNFAELWAKAMARHRRAQQPS